MSIFKRKDGRWVSSVKDRDTGRRVQKTFRTATEAETYETELYQDSRKASRLTVFEAVLLYTKSSPMTEYTKKAYRWLVSGATKEQWRSKKKVGYAECIADKYVDELKKIDLEAVRDNCRRGKCSNVTINMWTGKLNAAFNYAASEDLIKENPWKKYQCLKQKHGSYKGTLEDFQKVYALLPPWMQWACRTAMALAVRPGLTELFHLTWAAFDFRRGSVTVHMGKVDKDKTVFPPEWFMAEAKARFEADGGDRSRPVCPNSYGRMSSNGYHNAWGKACREAGVAMPFYAIRHITASEMLAAGADPAAVAANLGHSTPAITMQFYAHAQPAAQKAALHKICAELCKNEEKSSINSNT
jgi:integrase